MPTKDYNVFINSFLNKMPSTELPIADLRKLHEEWMQQIPILEDTRIEKTSLDGLEGIWYIAPEASKKRIILFFHGGGYFSGSPQSHQSFLSRLSQATKAAVLAISYRLAPEHPYPAALEDALQAYRWLLHHPYSRSKIIIAGASAGGGLALSLILKLKAEKIGLPKGILCFCPWVDLCNVPKKTNSSTLDFLTPEWIQFAIHQYAKECSLKDPLISPIYGDFQDFPPLFLQTGTCDLLHQEALQLKTLMEKQKVSLCFDAWPNMCHCWTLFAPSFPEAEKGIQKAGLFVDQLF